MMGCRNGAAFFSSLLDTAREIMRAKSFGHPALGLLLLERGSIHWSARKENRGGGG